MCLNTVVIIIRSIFVSFRDFSWISGKFPYELLDKINSDPNSNVQLYCRTRHRGDLTPCRISIIKNRFEGEDKEEKADDDDCDDDDCGKSRSKFYQSSDGLIDRRGVNSMIKITIQQQNSSNGDSSSGASAPAVWGVSPGQILALYRPITYRLKLSESMSNVVLRAAICNIPTIRSTNTDTNINTDINADNTAKDDGCYASSMGMECLGGGVIVYTKR